MAPGRFRKIYPNAEPGDTVLDQQLNEYVDAYYEYEYVIDGLLPSRAVYMSVSAFDFGNPADESCAAGEFTVGECRRDLSGLFRGCRCRLCQEGFGFPESLQNRRWLCRGGLRDEVSDFSRDENRARRIHFANLPPGRRFGFTRWMVIWSVSWHIPAIARCRRVKV